MGLKNWKLGSGAHYTIVVIRNPQNSTGNYLGPIVIAIMANASILSRTRLVDCT